ncbi:MAG: M4 family metallopeptidase [Polyangiales bacterium]
MNRRLLVLVALLGCSAPTNPELTLEAGSTTPVVYNTSSSGRVRGATLTTPVAGSSASERAGRFLDLYGAALGIDDPAQALREREVMTNDIDDSETVVYEGTQDGVVVFGSDYRVRVDKDGNVTYAGGSIVEDAAASLPDAELSAEEAVDGLSEVLGRPLFLGESQLVALNGGLFVGVETPSVLTWMVKVRGYEERWGESLVFINAVNGQEELDLPLAINARNRLTYSMGGRGIRTDPALAELQLIETDPQPEVEVTASARMLHDNTGDFYDYLESEFSRDSFDDAGADMVGYTDHDRAWDNAHWNGTATHYAPQYTTMDTVSHEYTHAIIEHTAGLEYIFESGAMNESLADVFAVFVVDGASWEFGDDDEVGAIRSLEDPTIFGHPNHTSVQSRPGTLDRCSVGAPCAGATEYCLTGICIDDSSDHGGVHSNSGIANHVIYLLSEGGTNAVSDQSVEGIGLAKVKKLVYRTLTGFLGATSRFVDYRFAMRASALEFIESTDELEDEDAAKFTYTDCGSVLNAFSSVGIGVTDTDNDCFDDSIDNCPCTYNPEQNEDDCVAGETVDMCEIDECVRIEDCGECMMNEACGFCDGSCRATDDEATCGSRVFDTDCDLVDCGSNDACGSCLDAAGCTWCGGVCQAARLTCLDEDGELIEAPTECLDCTVHTECGGCAEAEGCGWDESAAACAETAPGQISDAMDCTDPCDAQTDCSDCTTTPGCGWDGTACVTASIGSDVWTRESQCFDCSGFSNCGTCASNGFCAWCPGSGCENDALSMCTDRIVSAGGCE